MDSSSLHVIAIQESGAPIAAIVKFGAAKASELFVFTVDIAQL